MIVVAISLSDGDDVGNVLDWWWNYNFRQVKKILANSDIPKHHKVSLRSIPEGSIVTRDGFPIGFASSDINEGSHVHIHNLKSLRASSKQGAQLWAFYQEFWLKE